VARDGILLMLSTVQQFSAWLKRVGFVLRRCESSSTAISRMLPRHAAGKSLHERNARSSICKWQNFEQCGDSSTGCSSARAQSVPIVAISLPP
jgi:hypothetical protein